MNVLITSAGRRKYLIEAFQKALEGQGRVLACDASADAPALQAADRAFTVPLSSSPDYIPALLHLCRAHGIGLLLSLNDLETPYLARARDEFEAAGVIPVVPSAAVIERCFDKWQTFRWAVDRHLPTPRTYLTWIDAQAALDRGKITFPLVVKPRWGAASVGVEITRDLDDLRLAYGWLTRRLSRSSLAAFGVTEPDRRVLIQEWIPGQEYGLDVINDLSGHYAATFVKRKLSMRAGETDQAETVDHEPLRALGERIGTDLGHVGNLDCDVFLHEGSAYVLELNPRFGGGYPFSMAAGANVPAALLAWARGDEPDPRWLRVRPGVRSAKCDGLVIIEPCT